MHFKIQKNLKRGRLTFDIQKPKVSHIQPQTQQGCKETQTWPQMYFCVYAPTPITNAGKEHNKKC